MSQTTAGTSKKRNTRLEDLARLADVSIATVSRALNDSPAVNQATKERIWRIARDRNYAFRPSMPAILSGASATIAVVIPTPQGRKGSLVDPFFLELIGCVGEAARETGTDVLVSHIAPRNYDDVARLAASNRAEGVIFLGQSSLHERFNRLAETQKRFVGWGGALPGQRYCSVGSDNFRGGRRATLHLTRLGRRRIAFFGDAEAPEVLQRLQGYRTALEEAGLSPDDGFVSPVHFDIESAENAVESLLASGRDFDGAVCASDLVALGVVRGLLRRGRAVPRDVSVVGYDDLQLARFATPALTTISQNLMKAGRMLVSKLMSSTAGQEITSERLPTELIVRETCGA
ncbi:MAG: LacI family DNA-binding transcriptional regulator [Parvularculaceae bacterium]